MNKKGMTLIELIAVIAIMAILTLMIAPNIIEMRNQSIKSTIKNKINNVHNAAISYAEENLSGVPNSFTDQSLKNEYAYGGNKSNKCISEKIFDAEPEDLTYCEKYCLFVYIGTLIERGYLAGDNSDSTQLLDPLTGASLNDKRVCVRYDTDIVEIDASERMDRSIISRKLIAYIEKENSLCGSLGKCNEE